MKKLLIALLLFLASFFASATVVEKSDQTISVAIYYSNDIIGYLTPCG